MNSCGRPSHVHRGGPQRRLTDLLFDEPDIQLSIKRASADGDDLVPVKDEVADDTTQFMYSVAQYFKLARTGLMNCGGWVWHMHLLTHHRVTNTEPKSRATANNCILLSCVTVFHFFFSCEVVSRRTSSFVPWHNSCLNTCVTRHLDDSALCRLGLNARTQVSR